MKKYHSFINRGTDGKLPALRLFPALPHIFVLTLLYVFMTVPLLHASTAFADDAMWYANDFVGTEYNDTNGLPTSEANAVIQSTDGYLWVGSYGGLIRYDGTEFVNFSSELDTSTVRCIFQASDGRLYVGTNDKGVYVLSEGEFSLIPSPADSIFNSIRGFAEDSSGVIYAASTGGIGRIAEDGTLKIIYETDAGEQFYSIAVDGLDNVWAVSGSGNTCVFSPEGEMVLLISAGELFEDSFANAVAFYDGKICLASATNRIAFLSDIAVNDGILEFTPEFITFDGVSQINSLNSEKDGRLLVSAVSGFGFISTGDSGYSCTRVDCYSETSPIQANFACTDHEGNCWVASGSYGLVRFTRGCFESCNGGNGLGQVAVNAVCRQENIFYIATDSGLLTYDGNWHPLETEVAAFFEGIRIRNICCDTSGRVWFATHSESGAVCYDPETGDILTFGPDSGVLSNRVRVVYPLSDGRILVGHQMGFAIIDGDRICASWTADDGMSEPSVLCAMELAGRIYVGTDGSGIFSVPLNSSDRTLTQIGTEQGLESGVILRMCPDGDGNGEFFISSGDNLYYCDGNSCRVLSGIDKSEGSVYDIYDRNGRIYIMLNAGIFSCEKKALLEGEEPYTSFLGQSLGLTESLSANTWCDLEEDGRLYIPTRSGVCIYRFEIPEITLPYDVATAVRIDGTEYENFESVFVDKDCQRITISISALQYSDSVEFDLGYRLNGFDDAETLVLNTRSTEVSYTNIPGGEYTFTVRVINSATGNVADISELKIIKEKNLTEYPLFQILLFVAIAALAAVVASLIYRAKLERANAHQEELKRITVQSLKAVANTIDAKDAYTRGHSVRVAIYSRELARRLGRSDEFCERIYYIGLLHDIGKIGVPDAVLNKKGRLDDEEFALIKKHPVTGAEILKDINNISGLEDGVRYHHERYDGKGYCAGLKGEEIPEVARIICVADCYDAMQSARCYRPGLPEDVIRSELEKCSGSQFDPAIAKLMLEMMNDGTAPYTGD